MKWLSNTQVLSIVGGEISPGYPSQALDCINVKLLINAGKDEPGFDYGVAALAYYKYCPSNNFVDAVNYAHYGDRVTMTIGDILLSFILITFSNL
ncbi:MAG: hypothetical protein JSR17_10250 [Proteobacteria bacterium]|nr:hypothetical protein [Pseudomonadota bacterium]